MQKRRLAIFDIDGTIFRSSLVIELVNELVKQGIFPKKAENEIKTDYVNWVNRQGGYKDYIAKVVEIYRKNLKGSNEKEVKRIVREVVSDQKNKLYIYTRDLIKDLIDKNYFLLAISGSPAVMVSEFTRQLKFDYYFGAEYEVKDGKFTGVQIMDVGTDKTVLINNFIEKFKNQLSLKGSIGVGDTESDIPVLEFVENPIVFNPNLGLAKYAKKKKWRIIAERKDVIYDITDFKIIDNS
ncbi:MAG TPA: HAD-IB family hydrolase [Patescibacteria group bacterium]|nr:HAD-IB family hydrolase [Patescibacteria group bacterium]